MTGNTRPRRQLASVRRYDIIYLNKQNPVTVAWWSASFPGFGHLLLFKNTTGVILTLSEVIINTLAHINEAMVYTFCGKFEMATQAIRPLWMYGYLIIYFFAIWDSYRCCVEANKLYDLAEREQVKLSPLLMKSTGIQNLEKKRPLTAALCSLAFPGLGQIYNQHIWLGIYGLIWWWIYISFSHSYEGFLAMLNGHNDEVSAILQPQWLMFMPSVIGGAIYHSFYSARAQNRLFRLEQRSFLSKNYYSVAYSVQQTVQGGDSSLWIVGTFEHSTELEQALSLLEHKGIERSRIVPILMNSSKENGSVTSGPPSDRTMKAVELGMALATACGVIGISRGFILEWGPIIWGIISAVCGFLVGFSLFLLFTPRSGHSLGKLPKRMPEVTLMIQCRQEEASSIQDILWLHKAISVGVTPTSQIQHSS
ncbi:DUF5683 domain-containing protein [Paenibacillus hexagrammi]|uniref:DUF5683 domain-containing protein n=1 Tax=Paenibacillus hexagrammi TaxID=2908839 RepID=A0ABY3SG59_9BACL|nr:DUF5683 domain-containing protein [Paenibacillus sp. YPD9-1]UJF32906.1 DUF5683 domain-containing protein [Paenibacillus sp. YPD9-1]